MEDPEKDRGVNEEPGVGWRVSLSILGGVGWLAFLIVWLFFFAGDYSIYRNLAVLLVAVLLFGGIQGAMWAPWGMRHGDDFGEEGGER